MPMLVAPRLRVAVTHVPNPARRHFLDALLDRLGPDADVWLEEDLDRSGGWPTNLRAWQQLEAQVDQYDDDDWCLVLADDMLPSQGFMAAAPVALAAAADAGYAVASLFTGRRTLVDRADRAGSPWVSSPDAVWGGATAFRADALRHFLTWQDAVQRARLWPPSLRRRGDDNRYAAWLHHQGQHTLVAVPSLLEHAGAAVSEMGHSAAVNGRTAARFADDARPHTSLQDPAYWQVPAPAHLPAERGSLGTLTARVLADVRAYGDALGVPYYQP